MKRNLTASRPTRIKAPKSPRGIERKFASDVGSMVKLMSRIYRKQAIEALNAGTINKFADVLNKTPDGRQAFTDAQTGNYSKIFLKLSNAVQKKLLSRFSNTRIDEMVGKRLNEVDKSNSSRLYASIESKLGVSAKELAATEGMKATRNALIAETSQWIKKTRDETLEYFTSNTLRAMTLGQGLDKIMSEFDGMAEEREGHARFVAQNQINNYNSIMTKTRAQEVGVSKAIWRTEGDDKVRESHADRDGKEFDLSEGCYSSVDGEHLLPGVDYNCRCDYDLIIPDD